MNAGEDGISILAEALTNNTNLRSLYFGIGSSSNTVAAKRTFLKLVCDTSSINSIYMSNHTLGTIDCGQVRVNQEEYFHLNRQRERLEPENCGLIPMIKILINYPDLAEMEPFYQWKLKFLPIIVAWFQKACATRGYFEESVKKFRRREVSAVYKFIRGVPQAVADGYWSQQLKQVRFEEAQIRRKREAIAGKTWTWEKFFSIELFHSRIIDLQLNYAHGKSDSNLPSSSNPTTLFTSEKAAIEIGSLMIPVAAVVSSSSSVFLPPKNCFAVASNAPTTHCNGVTTKQG